MAKAHCCKVAMLVLGCRPLVKGRGCPGFAPCACDPTDSVTQQARPSAAYALQEAAINNAIGEAETISRRSRATADGLRMIAAAISTRAGAEAVSMTVAQQYVEAFGKIAQAGNTMIVPADAANVAGMVAQATSVFKRTSEPRGSGSGNDSDPPAAADHTRADWPDSTESGSSKRRHRSADGMSAPGASGGSEGTYGLGSVAEPPAMRADQRGGSPFFSLQS